MTSDDIVHTPRGIVFAPAADGVWMPYPALRDMLAGAVEDQRPLRVALAHSETLARLAEQERDEQAARARDLAGKLSWVPGVAFIVGAAVSAALVLGGLLASRTLATPSP